MKLDLGEVRRVAALAHLDLDAEQEQGLRLDLERILEYVEKLGELDGTAAVPRLEHPATPAPLREDRLGVSLAREEALANAPESGNGCFKVPRILP